MQFRLCKILVGSVYSRSMIAATIIVSDGLLDKKHLHCHTVLDSPVVCAGETFNQLAGS
jgi:hypothetical protein